jgi:hypothetical protein
MEVKYTVGSAAIILTNYGTLLGKLGDLAPAITLQSERRGNVLQKTIYRHEDRPLDLPFLFEGDNEDDLRGNVRAILDVLAAGEGILRITRTGVARELRNTWYTAGLREKGNGGRTIKTVLSFDALDPYWYDPTGQQVTFAGGVVAGTFFPFFPIVLSPSSVLAEETIVNPGVEAWPIWTISGPGGTITLENVTTGRKVVWNGTMADGETLVIDTRPLYKTVELNDANAWAYVSYDDTDLWPLAAGSNTIRVVMTGTDAGSQALLEYNPRYISL